jgi:hypothetical protein
MSNYNGVEPLRLRQLRAVAGNLYSLADWHREHHNYVVANALYLRSLSITEQINGAGNDGNNPGTRIQMEQQVARDLPHVEVVSRKD